MIKPLSDDEIHHKARVLIAQLQGVNPYDAARVLNRSTTIILEENDKLFEALKNYSVMPVNPSLLRKNERSKIMNDPELRSFIHLVKVEPGVAIISTIRAVCIKKFGKKRVPSRSAVGRYLLKMKKTFATEGENNGD